VGVAGRAVREVMGEAEQAWAVDGSADDADDGLPLP